MERYNERTLCDWGHLFIATKRCVSFARGVCGSITFKQSTLEFGTLQTTHKLIVCEHRDLEKGGMTNVCSELYSMRG